MTPEQQLNVLARVWDKGEGYEGHVFLPHIPRGGSTIEERRKSWKEGRGYKWPEERQAILEFLELHQHDDVYFTPNTFLGEQRVAQLTGEEKALYADLDEVDPRTDIDSELKPTIAWESSPGRFQAIWLLTEFADGATEPGKLNQRLTSQLGADPSGWDTTQLLRVPGRDNFKPQYRDEDGRPAPGRLLWVTGKRYKPTWFDAILPEVQTFGMDESVEDSEIEAVDRHAVWARVRMKCSSNVRQYMSMKSRNIDPEQHDRSEILWQIERDLADAGCTLAEIVAIVRHTPWNKHEGRRNELSQLKAEALKAKATTLQDAEEDTLEQAPSGLLPTQLTWFSDLSERSIPRPSWLIRNIWAKGSCGFISGAPKSYKSYFALDMAFSVATGTPFLNDPQFACKQGKVLYLQEEDSWPLIRARAEQIIEGKIPDRHEHAPMTLVGDFSTGAPKSLTDALGSIEWGPLTPIDTLAMQVRTGFIASRAEWHGWLDEMIEEHSFDLVIIDTLGTTVGDVDTDKSGPMNDRVLRPLKAIAENHGCAIAIVHHNRKPNDSGKIRSGQQMLGSVAMHAWVESGLYVQSKETIRDGVNEVKVDRENKLAEDLKFRVRIPSMTTRVTGDAENNERKVWEPEILLNWGDAEEALRDGEPIREEYKTTGTYVRGQKIAEAVEELDGEWHSLEDIVRETGKRRGEVVKQLNHAVAESLLQERNGLYRVL